MVSPNLIMWLGWPTGKKHDRDSRNVCILLFFFLPLDTHLVEKPGEASLLERESMWREDWVLWATPDMAVSKSLVDSISINLSDVQVTLDNTSQLGSNQNHPPELKLGTPHPWAGSWQFVLSINALESSVVGTKILCELIYSSLPYSPHERKSAPLLFFSSL